MLFATEADFLARIEAEPDSFGPKRIFADWLDEKGQNTRANELREKADCMEARSLFLQGMIDDSKKMMMGILWNAGRKLYSEMQFFLKTPELTNRSKTQNYWTSLRTERQTLRLEETLHGSKRKKNRWRTIILKAKAHERADFRQDLTFETRNASITMEYFWNNRREHVYSTQKYENETDVSDLESVLGAINAEKDELQKYRKTVERAREERKLEPAKQKGRFMLIVENAIRLFDQTLRSR